MLLVVGLVYCLLRWADMKRLWPFAIPFVLVAHVAMPGVYGTLFSKFHPKGGLIAQQKAGAGGYGSGRIADLGPGLHEWSHHPLVGDGFGTRIVSRGEVVPPNAPILDDQWLGTLLETGIVGMIAWIWIFGRAIRRLGGAARRDKSPHGWLLAGLAAAIAANVAGMAFYDEFGFTQETFLVFIVLAIGSVALAVSPAAAEKRIRRTRALLASRAR